jgi:hypothetical protein
MVKCLLNMLPDLAVSKLNSLAGPGGACSFLMDALLGLGLVEVASLEAVHSLVS